jgi:hypothetical protein
VALQLKTFSVHPGTKYINFAKNREQITMMTYSIPGLYLMGKVEDEIYQLYNSARIYPRPPRSYLTGFDDLVICQTISSFDQKAHIVGFLPVKTENNEFFISEIVIASVKNSEEILKHMIEFIQNEKKGAIFYTCRQDGYSPQIIDCLQNLGFEADQTTANMDKKASEKKYIELKYQCM